MPKPLSRFATTLFSKLPLRVVLIVPFVLQILLVAGLIGFLSFQNGQRAVKDLATQLEVEIGQRIEQTLQTYLKMPQLANQVTADAVRQGLLDPDNLEVLQDYLWSQFRQFNDQYSVQQFRQGSPNPQPDDISYLAIGTVQGNYVDVGYNSQHSRLEMGIRDRQTEKLQIWGMNQWGKRLEVLESTPYDHRIRNWYTDTVEAGRSIWVGPYVPVTTETEYYISSAQPLYDRRGNLLGVTDATLSLRDVSRFLQSLKVGQFGQIFITQLDGDMIATSNDELPFVSNGAEVRSIQVEESKDRLTRETAAYLRQKFGSFDRIDFLQQRRPQTLEFRDSQGKKQFVRVESLRNTQYIGIDWLAVITVPEEQFMGQIYENRRITTLLALLGLAGAIASGIVAGRWLTRPLVQLSRAANAVAQGDWDRPVTIQRSGELGVLVNAFNHMREELKQSQQQLEEYSRGLEQKNKQLETLEAELRRQLNLFLHAVSHDLRNPVLGTSMVLNNLSQQSNETVMLPRHILERMQDSNQRQLDLINSLIDTHGTEMWGITLYPKPLQLLPLVESAIADLQPMMAKEKTQLENYIPAELPPIEVDPLQLARVYQNLLANALKHNPPGLKIELNAEVEGDYILCTVADDGVGINPEQCEKLFDPYFRGNSKPKSIGLGLGLYLCQQIIEAHGGQIQVNSQIGQGTAFWFTLPLAKAVLNEHRSTVEQPAIEQPTIEQQGG